MASIEALSPNSLVVTGQLDFNNVVELRAQGGGLLAQAQSPVEINLSGVTRAGSAAVSLLLSWMRFAAARDMELVFCNPPEGLLGVAKVSGIDQILPLKFSS